MSIDDIIADFEFLDDWEERYRYVIELGRTLPPFPEEERTEANKVRGCASQVWLSSRVEPGAEGPRLAFVGDSDAHIVRGLIAILHALYSGRRVEDILSTDAGEVFRKLGLGEHLTQQRSNGFAAMVQRIKADAAAAAEVSAAG